MDKNYIIFDMDGTLIDSMGVWKNLGSEYLRKKGIITPPHLLSEVLAEMTMQESAEWLIQTFHLSTTRETVICEMNDMMEKHYRDRIPLKPGAQQLLQSFEKSGVQMCIASATDEMLVEQCLHRLGVRRFFSFILSCETIQKSKQYPDIYLEAAQRFGHPPADIAVYEDALYAIKTATKAGFYVVGVYDESSAKDWSAIQILSQETIVLN